MFLPAPALAVGSNAICESPDVSVLVPSASATVNLKALAVPVLLDDTTRRLPELSVTTEAVTPADALLMAAATPASVSLPELIVMFTGLDPDWAVNVLAPEL
jgi:hypothetical protein